MNSPLNDAKVGASTLAARGYAPVQWKIALGWMRDANMACPFANEAGPRTSTSMKSGLADLRLSRTSQLRLKGEHSIEMAERDVG